MFCSECGKEISDAAKFCVSCGNQISKPEPVVEPEPEPVVEPEPVRVLDPEGVVETETVRQI